MRKSIARRSNTKITPHGGAVPILKKIKEFGIPQLIRECLGKRKAQAIYSYEDIIIAWVLTALCGGTRLDHITKIKKKLNIIPNLKLPSHDTLGRGMKQLATETIIIENVKGRGDELSIHKNHVCENLKLNELLIKVSKRTGALKENISYTLHIDATFIETNCATAHREKNGHMYGFYPMICLIKDLPVYISMRNGDSNARFELKECLERCLDLLAQSNIKIDRVISDSAGYNIALMDMLHSRGIKFNIHVPVNNTFKSMFNQIDNCKNWEKTEMETSFHVRECEIGEINYRGHESENVYRLVVAREYNKKTKLREEESEEKERRLLIEEKMKVLENKNLLKGNTKAYTQGNWKKYKQYKIKIIVTNDRVKTPEQVIVDYNGRGGAERIFDFMKNDWGWALPPFMKMNENAVFMIVSALANNIFKGMVATFKKQIPELRLNARLREFKFVFIDVACALINGVYEFYNTDIAYEKIM